MIAGIIGELRVRRRQARWQAPDRVLRRFPPEIVQPPDRQDHRFERGGDSRVRHVGEMRFSIDLIAPDLAMEGALHLARRAAERDKGPPSGYVVNRKTCRL